MLEAFDTLFNKRDYAAAERFWSDRYIQHSAHIPPGRDGLFNLVRGLPDTLRYENQVILAEGDYVIAHGRFSGHGRPRSWIAADIVRFEDGRLAEHWDVLQDEATQAESAQRAADVRRPFPGLSAFADFRTGGPVSPALGGDRRQSPSFRSGSCNARGTCAAGAQAAISSLLRPRQSTRSIVGRPCFCCRITRARFRAGIFIIRVAPSFLCR